MEGRKRVGKNDTPNFFPPFLNIGDTIHKEENGAMLTQSSITIKQTDLFSKL